ncbi:MAG: cyclic nucleotide-binding domain-containing protein [Chloroflexaceae bacterium]|nr:cyclic nucleotide-binding domain-containing protein [Chloroflexaceae bacterium]
MQTIEDMLKDHPFFDGLSAEHLAFLAGCASNIHFQAGDIVFREGTEANSFYVIRQGKVTVETLVEGRGPIVFETIGEGNVLGWSWLFPPYRWAYDARALETTRATVFDGVCLRNKCEAEPVMGYNLMQRFAHIITQRLQATRSLLVDLKF